MSKTKAVEPVAKSVVKNLLPTSPKKIGILAGVLATAGLVIYVSKHPGDINILGEAPRSV